jgi:DNA-binding CsgD family transcriptional regulator
MSWSPSREVPLFGRSGETALLHDALERVGTGRGGLLVLTGEAGIGKTSLLGRLLGEANGRGYLTLVGRAREVEREWPFGAIADLVESTRAPALAGVAAALRPGENVAMADRSLTVAEALVEALEAEAMVNGVVLALEDGHWADAGTVAVVARLARSVPALPVLLALTVRPTPARRDLQLTLDALAELGAVTVALGALAADAVAELVEQRFGRPPSPRLRDHLATCGGNPFYVIELLTALEREAALHTAPDVVDLGSDVRAVPASARVALVRHLGFLPPDAYRVLQVAAVLGESFTAKDLAAVSGRPVTDLLVQLEDALRSELIVADGDRWAFRHDLVRQSLEEGLAPTARKALHHAAAEALERVGAPPAVVARHLALGADSGDRRAIAGLRAAAAEALRSSISAGIELLQAALDLTGPTDPERIDIITALLDPLNASGRADEAEALARSVLGAPVPAAQEAMIAHALASTLYAKGDMAAAIDVIAPLLDRPDVEGSPRAVLHSAVSVFSMLRLDLDSMVTHAAAAVEAAATTDDHHAIGLAANTTAMSLLSQARPREAHPHAIEARDQRVAGGIYSWMTYNSAFTLSLVALEQDDLDGALGMLANGRPELEACGNVSWLVQYSAVESLVPFVAGDLDRAEDVCRLAQQLPLDYGPRYQQGVRLGLLSLIARRRGDVAAAAAHAEEAERHYLEHGPQLGIELAWLATALGKVDAGDPTEALEILRLAWALTDPLHVFVSLRILAPEVARLAHGRDPELGRRIADEAEEAARRNPVASMAGVAALVRALAHDDPDPAIEAVGLLARSPRRLTTADAATDAVRLLRAAGRRDEARVHYELAREAYAAAGALGDLDRLRRTAGLRRTGAPVARPTSGWDSLTRSEREVVALLQDGLTNRQIGDALGISRRTVETHLSHAFVKVGVTTRVQLAAEAAKRP